MANATEDQPDRAGSSKEDWRHRPVPEKEFESLTLTQIGELPKLSELPRWLRLPLERLKRSR
jgi:hypothetical protein